MCRPAGWPRAWRCSTRPWPWPADRPTTRSAAKSVCSFFTACYYTADFERAGSWADLLRQRGLIGLTPGPAVPVRPLRQRAGHAARGARAVGRGRGGPGPGQGRVPGRHAARAGTRTSLLADLASAKAGSPRPRRCCSARTRRCRRSCRRPASTLPGATTTWPAPRRVACGPSRDDRLRAVELLAVLVDAEFAAGGLDGGRAAARSWRPRGAARRADRCVPAPRRPGAGRWRRQATRGAVAALEAPVDRLDAGGSRGCGPAPGRAGPAARAGRRRRGRRLDAGGGGHALARSTSCWPPADAALLERLVAQPASPAPPVAASRCRADGKWWTATCGGTTCRLADSKGLRYLAELVAPPGRGAPRARPGRPGRGRRPPAASTGAPSAMPASCSTRGRGGLPPPHRGAAGRDRRRPRGGRLERAEALQAELDELVRQLARAFGLGGRDRRAASAAERARLNVTRAAASGPAQAGRGPAGAGAALAGVRTGLYCAYEPADDDSPLDRSVLTERSPALNARRHGHDAHHWTRSPTASTGSRPGSRREPRGSPSTSS